VLGRTEVRGLSWAGFESLNEWEGENPYPARFRGRVSFRVSFSGRSGVVLASSWGSSGVVLGWFGAARPHPRPLSRSGRGEVGDLRFTICDFRLGVRGWEVAAGVEGVHPGVVGALGPGGVFGAPEGVREGGVVGSRRRRVPSRGGMSRWWCSWGKGGMLGAERRGAGGTGCDGSRASLRPGSGDVCICRVV
jgi:hypothetical protein